MEEPSFHQGSLASPIVRKVRQSLLSQPWALGESCSKSQPNFEGEMQRSDQKFGLRLAISNTKISCLLVSLGSEMFPFESVEFSQRWLRARISAANLGEVVDSDNDLDFADEYQRRWSKEIKLVNEIPLNMFDFALRDVFDKSRKLAISASRHYRIRLEIADFQALLNQSGIPCAAGEWSVRSQARVVSRTGCSHALSKNTRMCDWYREAIDGVVVGLGETERFVRHKSEAHGDDSCLDVIFDDAPHLQQEELLYGPIPAPFQPQLKEAISHYETRGFQLVWKGYRAGTVFYTLAGTDIAEALCQSRGRIAHLDLQDYVRKIFPTLRIQDASPLAVYAEGTR